MRAGEIDDDGLGRSVERGGPLVVEAAEDELRAGGRPRPSFETNDGTLPFRRGSSALAG